MKRISGNDTKKPLAISDKGVNLISDQN